MSQGPDSPVLVPKTLLCSAACGSQEPQQQAQTMWVHDWGKVGFIPSLGQPLIPLLLLKHQQARKSLMGCARKLRRGTPTCLFPPPKGGQLGMGPEPIQTLPFAWWPKERRGG